MTIVETNISYSFAGIEDHQSRVIEILSWEEYCDLYRNYTGKAIRDMDVKFKDVYNTLINGCLLPRDADILCLTVNDINLTCNFKLWNGNRQYKLAYILKQ